MKKILLIMFEEIVFNKKHLEEIGFAVMISKAGDDGLEQIQNCEFDLIIIGNQPLYEDGITLYSEIRKYCYTPIRFVNKSDCIFNKIVSMHYKVR